MKTAPFGAVAKDQNGAKLLAWEWTNSFYMTNLFSIA